MLGDFNTPVQPVPSLIGEGIAKPGASRVQTDYDQFLQLVRAHACSLLNTWSKAGPSARTFLPAVHSGPGHGAQIDFVMTRGKSADGVAKEAKPIEAPFVPRTGCRHLPVECFIRKPTRPNVQHGPQRIQPHEVRQQLSQAPLSQLFTTHMDKVLRGLDHQTDSLDQKLLEGWRQCIQIAQPPKPQRPLPTTMDSQESFSDNIHQMWRLRQVLRSMPSLDTTAPATALLQQVFAGWSKAATLQAITCNVRKAGRDRKLQKVKQVLDSGDIFNTAKCLAPQTLKRRIQLRDEQGSMQSHDQEHGQLVDYFRKLYDGLRSPPSLLTTTITLKVEEITAAIAKMSPAKVMPSCSAPTALWKWTSKSAAHILRRQFEYVFQPGEVHIPSAWNVSELVLLPKPGKPLRKPSDLRPISLLPPEMKILSSVIAARVRPQVQTYLASIPQFAYVSGRTLQDAVTRVTSHCSEVRTLIQSEACNIHTKRGGRTQKNLYGGVQLSLDVSKAFDCLPREDLRQALVEAQVDSDMITAILITHDEACLRITNCGRSAEVETKRGVLQGSGPSPMLWALFSGYVLRHMDTAVIDAGKTNTTYADDFHFSWTIAITSMAEFDKAYAAIQHVLQVLQQRGLSISADKTVIILDITEENMPRKRCAGMWSRRARADAYVSNLARNAWISKLLPAMYI